VNRWPTTANQYYVQDEWGEILLEVDNLDVAVRCEVRWEMEGKNVKLVDRREDCAIRSGDRIS